MTVRVMIYAVAPDSDPAGVENAYHKISTELAGTPGLLGNELLRECGDRPGFVVMSEWENMPAFQHWEQGSDHRNTTSPLRPYQDSSRGTPFALYEVVVKY